MSLFRLKPLVLIATITMAVAGAARGEEITVTLNQVTPEGTGKEFGTVTFSDHRHGLMIAPDLRDLTPGPHGAHIHENPDCGPDKSHGKVVAGGAAGGHFDPDKTGQHAGPYGDGHLGDLPNLIVEEDGTATLPVVAPRVRLADIRSRALMIHAGADRYRRHGGHAHGKGGMRMYCGVIP